MKQREHLKCKGLGLGLLLAVLLTGCGLQTTAPETTQVPVGTVSVREDLDISLGQGLRVLRMDRYAGVYMEDGTNEIVTDVMMLVLENTAQADLQLARIDVRYGDQTLWFEVTDLPAGEKAVLLEKERRACPQGEPVEISARNVVFFPEPMALKAGVEISGSEGLIRLTNTTGEAVPGPVSVYYKYSGGDMLYGGITFRAVLEEGLAPGGEGSIPAGHYSPENCRVVELRCGG